MRFCRVVALGERPTIFLVFAFVFFLINLFRFECGLCGNLRVIGKAKHVYAMHTISTVKRMCDNFHTQN